MRTRIVGMRDISPFVPLATVSGSALTAVAALLVARVAARTSHYTAHGQQRIEAVSVFLDAVDALLVEEPPADALREVSSSVLRIQLFYEDDPVRIAHAMHEKAQEVASLAVSPPVSDGAEYLGLIRKLAAQESRLNVEGRPGEDEYPDIFDHGALLQGVLDFQRRADEAFARGEAEPDRRKAAEALTQYGYPEVGYRQILLALGSAHERAERRKRWQRTQALQEELATDRRTLVNAVAPWVKTPPRRPRAISLSSRVIGLIAVRRRRNGQGQTPALP